MDVGVQQFVALSGVLFAIGLYTALAKRNAIAVLMGVEIMLNAVNIAFVAFSRFIRGEDPLAGQVFVVFTLTVAAAEAALMLAIAVAIYRGRESVEVDEITDLKA